MKLNIIIFFEFLRDYGLLKEQGRKELFNLIFFIEDLGYSSRYCNILQAIVFDFSSKI